MIVDSMLIYILANLIKLIFQCQRTTGFRANCRLWTCQDHDSVKLIIDRVKVITPLIRVGTSSDAFMYD